MPGQAVPAWSGGIPGCWRDMGLFSAGKSLLGSLSCPHFSSSLLITARKARCAGMSQMKKSRLRDTSLVPSQCPAHGAQATLPSLAHPSSPYLIPISSITLERLSLFSISWV